MDRQDVQDKRFWFYAFILLIHVNKRFKSFLEGFAQFGFDGGDF